MAKMIQNIADSQFILWLQETTIKQRIVLGISAVTVLLLATFGIYQMFKPAEANATDSTTKTEVNVEEIDGMKSNTSTTSNDANVNAIPSTYDPTTSPTYNRPTGESNVATVEVPAADDNTYEYGSDGAIYEGSDEGYVDPTPAPVYEPAPANAGWDGNLNIPDGDSTGASGKPIFGNE